MPAERYFLDAPFSVDASLSLEGSELHHLSRVMRARSGDQIELVNGRGELAQATLLSLDKHRAALHLTALHTEKSSANVILAQGIPRFNRLEFILEKGVELNASAFWLFPSVHSEKETFSPNQHQRMHTLTVAALKQCGRLDLPPVIIKPPLSQWEIPEGTLLFGDTRQTAPLLSSYPLSQKPIFLFIGPESGFHPSELAILEQRFKAQGVKLHRNILRTDTAAIAGLSIINSN
jgi:16S rRNA (uracil1498-N3)-methyltransferase